VRRDRRGAESQREEEKKKKTRALARGSRLNQTNPNRGEPIHFDLAAPDHKQT